MSDQLAQVRKAARAHARAVDRAAVLEGERDAVMCAASERHSYRAIAGAAELSFQRVAQIVSEAKEERT